jgi:catechol 2,3-dioxygenase-like lactoylglutathione lyase family enzyme
MAAIAIVTLGVADVARSTAFYEAIGFRRSVALSRPSISFFAAGGTVLALYGHGALADDAGLPAEPRAPFSGVTLARCLASREAVDAAFAAALAAGASALKAPHDAFWGGYSSYVADPDGHPIEIAWNPFIALRADGSLELPPDPPAA